jgi:hypothetical protein
VFRQLLTLLALFTSLVAVGAPVHAANPGATVASASQAEAATPCRRAHVVLQLGDAPTRARATRERGCAPVARSIVIVPSVQLQADRAHE